jgi:hypothetical protein
LNDYGITAVFHEDVFHAYYRPYRPEAISVCDCLGECWILPSLTAFDALQRLDIHHVWTIVTGDSGRDVFFATGFHIVNREGYMVTHRSHNFELVDFRSAWRGSSLTELGLKREIKKLESFLQRANQS